MMMPAASAPPTAGVPSDATVRAGVAEPTVEMMSPPAATPEILTAPTVTKPSSVAESTASSKVHKVDLAESATDIMLPRMAGTTITVTARPIGGVGPYQYQWRLFEGRAWSLPTEWSESATFTWTPSRRSRTWGSWSACERGQCRAPKRGRAACGSSSRRCRPRQPFPTPVTMRLTYNHAIGADNRA
jgi:hypothetical protein